MWVENNPCMLRYRGRHRPEPDSALDFGFFPPPPRACPILGSGLPLLDSVSATQKWYEHAYITSNNVGASPATLDITQKWHKHATNVPTSLPGNAGELLATPDIAQKWFGCIISGYHWTQGLSQAGLGFMPEHGFGLGMVRFGGRLAQEQNPKP